MSPTFIRKLTTIGTVAWMGRPNTLAIRTTPRNKVSKQTI